MLFYHGGNISERGQKISYLKEKARKYICMIFFSPLKFILSSLTNQRREISFFCFVLFCLRKNKIRKIKQTNCQYPLCLRPRGFTFNKIYTVLWRNPEGVTLEGSGLVIKHGVSERDRCSEFHPMSLSLLNHVI